MEKQKKEQKQLWEEGKKKNKNMNHKEQKVQNKDTE